jgi:hypothetical protein
MKSSKTFFVLCVAGATTLSVMALIMLFIVLVASILSDEVTEVYANASDAQENDALARGIVPDFLPESATQIISTHYIEARQVFVEFSYAEDFMDFLVTQKAIKTPPPGLTIPRPKGGTFDISRSDSLIYIQCANAKGGNSKGSLIVNTVQKRALFIDPALDQCACSIYERWHDEV